MGKSMGGRLGADWGPRGQDFLFICNVYNTCLVLYIQCRLQLKGVAFIICLKFVLSNLRTCI